MTIRSRNRFTFAFFIISLIIFLLAIMLTSYQILNNIFTAPEVYKRGILENTLLTYNTKCVLLSIFLLMAYVCITTLAILRSFEKTQAPGILFFLLFLLACLFNSFRLLFGLFHISGTYSKLLLKLGNLNIFSLLLAPLSLFGTTTLSTDELRQNTDRNCIILLLVSFFFADFIPLNTGIIMPNFCISYSYVLALRATSCIICIINCIGLYLTNKKNDYSQKMTFGFLMICIGYSIMFYCYNILGLISGPLLLGIGTTIYLNEVHHHYLWLD